MKGRAGARRGRRGRGSLAPRLLLAIAVGSFLFSAAVRPAGAEEADEAVGEAIQELFLGETVYPQEQLELQATSSLRFERAASGSAFTAMPFFELGLTDRLQIGVELPFESMPNAGGRAAGLGNVGAGVLYNVFSSRRLGFAGALALEVSLPSASEGVGEDAWGIEPAIVAYKVVGGVHLNLVVAAEIEIPTEPGEEVEVMPSAAAGIFVPLPYVVPTLELAVDAGSSPALVGAAGLISRLSPEIEVGAAFFAGLDERSFGAMLLATWELELAGEDDAAEDEARAPARLLPSGPL